MDTQLPNTHVRRERPLTSLVADLWRDAANLIRGEAALAKAELAEKAARLSKGLVWIAAGAVAVLAGLVFLLLAVMTLLAAVLPEDQAPWLAPLIVGAVVTGIGVALLLQGRNRLDPENLKPTQAVRSMRKDVDIVKEHMQ